MNFKKEIKKFKRTCYQPIVEVTDNLNYAGSKYYGNIWISSKEKWPVNDAGTFYTFVYQLDIKTLPEEYQKKLNKTGIIQFFYDTSNLTEDSDYLVRVVEPNDSGRYFSQPINQNENHNYKINDESPKPLIIKEWKAHDDYPSWDESFDELSELWESIQEHVDFDDEKYSPILGDKLGGYCYFAQSGESSNGLIYQIQFDENEEYEKTQFPSYAPCLIASDGTGHLFFYGDEEETDKTSIGDLFYFSWSCG